jgi:hypothetical protein
MIKDIPGLRITEYRMEKIPRLPIPSLSDEKCLAHFIQALDWLVQQIREVPDE